LENIRKILEVLLLIAVVYLLFAYMAKPRVEVETVTETVIDTLYVETVDTVFVSTPAVIDTVIVVVDGQDVTEVKASADTTFIGDNYQVRVEVDYWTKRQLFDIRSEIKVTERTIIINNTITEYATQRKAILKPFFGLAISKHAESYFGQITAGVCVLERVDLFIGVDTSERIVFGTNYRF
jgi:hypothetical protein